MDAEFVFRDAQGRPAALPSLTRWRALTAIPFSRRPPELARVDALYADLLRARRGGFAFLRAAVLLKDALNRFFADTTDSSKRRRIRAGGAVMERLFQALADFTGDLAGMPVSAPAPGIPPADHAHARFGILWVLANVKVHVRPSALIAGSLEGLDAGLSLARAAGGIPRGSHSEHVGFGFREGGPHLHRDARMAYPETESRLYRQVWHEIVKMLRDVVQGLWEDVKRKARFFIHPTWEGFENIVQSATRYIMQFVRQIPPYVAPAVSIVNGLRRAFAALRAARDVEALFGRFEPAAGHIAAYARVVGQEARKRALDRALDVAVVSAFTALGFTVPAIASLAEPIVRIMKWTLRAVLRAVEKLQLDAFLGQARRHFEAEPRGGEGALRFQPAAAGGLVHDAARFDRFFDEGCRISPVVPFLALNTGVCGALLTKFRLTGSTPGEADGHAYLAALRYFEKARAISQRYLRDSGFTFTTVKGGAAAGAVMGLALATPVMTAGDAHSAHAEKG